MPTKKRTAKTKTPRLAAGPVADRPKIEDYGIPKDKKDLLPWSHVTERLVQARSYWVSTVSPDGRPHATPVDGMWVDDRLYFGGSPTTRRHRNLAANSAAAVHLESASDIVILHGKVRELVHMDPELARRLAEASNLKYGFGQSAEDYSRGGVFEFRPRVGFAWSNFPRDVTRWRIEEGA